MRGGCRRPRMRSEVPAAGKALEALEGLEAEPKVWEPDARSRRGRPNTAGGPTRLGRSTNRGAFAVWSLRCFLLFRSAAAEQSGDYPTINTSAGNHTADAGTSTAAHSMLARIPRGAVPDTCQIDLVRRSLRRQGGAALTAESG